MRVTFRPTRAEDLPACIGEPLPFRIRAITALAGDQVIAIGGIGYKPDGTVVAFAQLNDPMRLYPAAIHRAGILGMALIRASGVPLVIAEAQPDNPATERWLLYHGFVPIEIGDAMAFVWRRSE